MSTYLPRIFNIVRTKPNALGEFSHIAPLISITTFFMLSDAILSYSVPIYVDKLFSNDFIVGLVISLSSVVGFCFDFFSKKLMGHKGYKSFISLTLLFAIVFAVSLRLAFEYRYLIIIAMAAWGVYYETLAFANYKFLKAKVPSSMYTASWSIITALKSFLYTLGPILSGYFIAVNVKLPIYISISILAALSISFILLFANKKSHIHHIHTTHDEVKPKSKYHEIKVWFVILKRLYPIWILNLSLVIIDACFWTTGVLFAESSGGTNPIAKLFLPLFIVPSLIFSPISPLITSRIGKKTTAIVFSGIGSLFLICFGLFHSMTILPILFCVFVYALCTAIVFPAIYASFEDYVKRLGKYDTDFIGLEQASSSIGYIIGPMLAGFIALNLGHLNTFSLMGVGLVVVTIFAGIATPKKIKMPIVQLSKVD